ncbi:hypothetical protein GCM10007895_16910 [Paraferrimonas sedimenticola]|uniref:Transposase n=2 Tax=Paraferrimonas sedimenticola TaxID=375674 RepID=A0AA37W0J2_9GAMM|nr:hypothetical protein GCM10007895_16910 [Paraferrimonas sedimenticola]
MNILKQGKRGVPVRDICLEHGISASCYHRWRSKFGDMDTSLMAQLKEVEAENRRLKKIYAESL